MVATRRSAKKAPEVAAPPPPTLKAPPKRAPRKKAAAVVEKPAPAEKPAPPPPAEKPAPRATTASKRNTRVAAEPEPAAPEVPKKTRGRKAAVPAAPKPAPKAAPKPAPKAAPIVKAPAPAPEPEAPTLKPTRATRSRQVVVVSPLKTAARKRPTRKQAPAKKIEKEDEQEADELQEEAQIPAEIANDVESLQQSPTPVRPATMRSPPTIVKAAPVLARPVFSTSLFAPSPSVVAPAVSFMPDVPESTVATSPARKAMIITPSVLALQPTVHAPVVEQQAIFPSPVREQHRILQSPVREQKRAITPPTPIVEHQRVVSSPVKEKTPSVLSPANEISPVLVQQPIPPTPIVLQERAVTPPVSVQPSIFTLPKQQLSLPKPLVEQQRAITPPIQENAMLPPPFYASPVKSALRSPKKLETKTPPKKSVSWTSAQEDFESSLLVHDGPLTGTVFYVDVTSNGKSQNHLFTGLLEDLGAQVVKEWSNNGLTHVLFKDGSQSTLERVRGSRDVRCVNVGWALDCEKDRKRVDEMSYLVNLGTPIEAPAKGMKPNPYTPARTPSRYLLEDEESSLASIPNTPTSSEFERSIVYDDKENSFNGNFLAKITKQGQQSCPPKTQTMDNPKFGGGSFLHKSPMKTPLKPSFLKMTPIRPWTSVKRKAESIGGITMAPAKRLNWGQN